VRVASDFVAVMKKKRGPKMVSGAHRAAMAVGRAESRAVSEYLDMLVATRPKRGRKRTADTINARLVAIEAEFDEAALLARVGLIQERMDLEAEPVAMDDKVDVAEFEAAFVAVANSYSRRRGISYAAWREIGVAAVVLREAGISRSSSA
jgi:hypothetical protein